MNFSCGEIDEEVRGIVPVLEGPVDRILAPVAGEYILVLDA